MECESFVSYIGLDYSLYSLDHTLLYNSSLESVLYKLYILQLLLLLFFLKIIILATFP